MKASGEYNLTVLQNAVAVTGDGSTLRVFDVEVAYAVGCFQITGSFTATINFECTLDGSNWVALECQPVGATASVVTSATAAGIWRFNALGLYAVRARVTWSSGTSVTVTASLVS